MRQLFRTLILLLFWSFLTVKLFAQGTPTVPDEGVTITKAIPASADAAALGKFGSIPVSNYTGVPNISIPLYTIKSGDLTLPISINYHAGGFKVDEMASSVGLGWALNAGGSITRSQRGKADEDLDGFMSTVYPKTIDSLIRHKTTLDTAGVTELNLLLNKVADGTIDAEPDVFNFNFGSYSGKFTIDSRGNFHTFPLQNINFTVSVDPGQTAHISAFTAKTPDGVTYYFGLTGATEYTNSSNNNRQTAMSWFVTRIVSPSLHEINFTYKPESYSTIQAPTQTIYDWVGFVTAQPAGGAAPPPTNNFGNSTAVVYTTVKLQSISFENGSLTVYANSNRNDLNPLNDRNTTAIDSISVQGSTLAKKFKFYYLNTTSNRMRLDSLVELLEPITGTGKYKKSRYAFSYIADPWTSNINANFLLNQDWWGFYNGRLGTYYGTATYVPQFVLDTSAYSHQSQPFPGANRAADEVPMLGGVLNKIVYPTGGYTQFNFEANDESNIDLQGTSSIKYPTTAFTCAISNDPGSIYYHYNANNGNPNNLMTINANGDNLVPVHFTAYGLGSAAPPPSPPYPVQDKVYARLYKKDSVGNYSILTYSFNSTDTTVNLKNGVYQMQLGDPSNQTDSTQFTYWIKYAIAAQWSGYSPAQLQAMNGNFIVGGLRIQQIADYDGVNSAPVNLRVYQYKAPGLTTSSGYLDYQGVFIYRLDIEKIFQNLLYVNAYLTRTSFSNYPMATNQGSVVGYAHVTELLGKNGQNGKNEYFYTNSATNPDILTINGNNFPYAPAASQDWRRGQLLKQTTWKNNGSGTFVKLSEKANVYSTVKIANIDTAIKAGFNPKPAIYQQGNPYYLVGSGTSSYGRLQESTFYDKTDFTYLSSDTSRTYDPADQTKFVQAIGTYQYDTTTYQVTKVQTTNSKNELITQTVTYPYNYFTFGTPTGSLAGIQYLNNAGITTYPIEEVTSRSNIDGTSSRTIKAVLTTYKTTGPYRDSVFQMRSVAGVTGFVPSSAGTNNVTMDSHYQPVVAFNRYDIFGNILQEHKVGDAYHTYIWGYNDTQSPHSNTYPVAEVINADTASIAYTNFEQLWNNGTKWGGWTFTYAAITTDASAPMGPACYTVSSTNTLVKSGLNSSNTYVVSFWSKSGASITVTGGTVTNIATGNAKSGWLYHEYQVSGTTSVTIGGSGLVDEVRLYPSTAQMSTYTYTPLVGMASKCDTKNDITYFIYDNVGRLLQVLDQNRNVVKQYQYNYKNSDH